MKKAHEELVRAWGGLCACCDVAGRQTRRQGQDVSMGEAGTGLVPTCLLLRGMNAELGRKGPRWATWGPGALEPEKGGSCPTSFSLAPKTKGVEFGGCP